MLQGLPCDGNAGRRGGECLSSFPGLICWSGRAVPQRRRTGPPRQTFACRLLYGGTVPLVPPKPVAGRCAAPVQGWKGLSRRGHAAACFLGDTRRLLLAAGAGVLLSCTEFWSWQPVMLRQRERGVLHRGGVRQDVSVPVMRY